MANKIPRLSFNNGYRIPMVGLGTWKSKPKELNAAVRYAIECGYRHIDCAYFYQNERHIGAAIEACKPKREDLFVTGKLWNTFHKPELVERAIKYSLEDLRLNYLDLFLMHWPMAYKEGDKLVPTKNGKVLYSDVDYLDTWKAMEELVKKCLTKSIGFANFNKRQIERVLKSATIRPVVNQVECHPYLNQSKLMEFCRSKQILIICYSPLGSPDRPWAKRGEPTLLQDPTILALAKKYHKEPSQIILRYQVQRGNVVIPKSVTPARIQRNMELFDFQLCEEDMQEIGALNRGERYVALRGDHRNPHHPFVNDEY